MVNTMGGNYLIENRDDHVVPACNFLELWKGSRYDTQVTGTNLCKTYTGLLTNHEI